MIHYTIWSSIDLELDLESLFLFLWLDLLYDTYENVH